MDGTSRTVTSDYDSHGNRTRVTHPDGAFFENVYEPTNNLIFMSENGPSTALVSNLFDGFGRRYQINRDTSGSVTAIGFDEISRLRSIGQNLDGNPTTTYDVGIGFSYNPASQVAARSQTNSVYDYSIAALNQTYTANGRNQYTQVGGATITWDANGNLTSDGATTFVFDTENRLTSATGAKSATLTYDPLGRLYQVTSGGVTTRFLYDGDQLILEYNGSGVAQRRYVHGVNVDEPLVWYEGSTVSAANRRYLHADHQGSTIATTNAAGTTLNIGTYDAYGVTSAPSTWRFQYTGQTAIPQVGLYYYKARFYNPALGRFMQTDPIGYDDDVNLYAYVSSDPINGRDPTGNTCVNCAAAGAAGLGGFFIGAIVNAVVQHRMRGEVDYSDAFSAGLSAGAAAAAIAFNPANASNPVVIARISGVTSAAGSAVSDVANGQPVDLTKAGIAGVAGAAAGPAGAKAGDVVETVAANRAASSVTGEVTGVAVAEGVTAGVTAAGPAATRAAEFVSETANDFWKAANDAIKKAVDPRDSIR